MHRVLIIFPEGQGTWTSRGRQNRQEFLNIAAYNVCVYIMHTTGIRGLVDLRGPGDICSGLRGKGPGGGGNKWKKRTKITRARERESEKEGE